MEGWHADLLAKRRQVPPLDKRQVVGDFQAAASASQDFAQWVDIWRTWSQLPWGEYRSTWHDLIDLDTLRVAVPAQALRELVSAAPLEERDLAWRIIGHQVKGGADPESWRPFLLRELDRSGEDAAGGGLDAFFAALGVKDPAWLVRLHAELAQDPSPRRRSRASTVRGHAFRADPAAGLRQAVADAEANATALGHGASDFLDRVTDLPDDVADRIVALCKQHGDLVAVASSLGKGPGRQAALRFLARAHRAWAVGHIGEVPSVAGLLARWEEWPMALQWLRAGLPLERAAAVQSRKMRQRPERSLQSQLLEALVSAGEFQEALAATRQGLVDHASDLDIVIPEERLAARRAWHEANLMLHLRCMGESYLGLSQPRQAVSAMRAASVLASRLATIDPRSGIWYAYGSDRAANELAVRAADAMLQAGKPAEATDFLLAKVAGRGAMPLHRSRVARWTEQAHVLAWLAERSPANERPEWMRQAAEALMIATPGWRGTPEAVPYGLVLWTSRAADGTPSQDLMAGVVLKALAAGRQAIEDQSGNVASQVRRGVAQLAEVEPTDMPDTPWACRVWNLHARMSPDVPLETLEHEGADLLGVGASLAWRWWGFEILHAQMDRLLRYRHDGLPWMRRLVRDQSSDDMQAALVDLEQGHPDPRGAWMAQAAGELGLLLPEDAQDWRRRFGENPT